MPRTPLLRPGEYFRRRNPDRDLGRAFVVVLVVAVVTTAAAAGIGWLFTQKLDFAITVQNPNHVPDWACQSFNDTGTMTATGCGTPATKQVNLGTKVWHAFLGYLPLVFFLPFVGWLGAAVLAHLVTGFLDDARGSFADTLAVSGWAAAPGALQAIVAVAVLSVQLGSLTVPHDLQAAAQKLQSLTGFGHGPLLLLVSLLVVVWKASIWRNGLVEARGTSPDLATGLAVLAGLIAFIGAVVH